MLEPLSWFVEYTKSFVPPLSNFVANGVKHIHIYTYIYREKANHKYTGFYVMV